MSSILIFHNPGEIDIRGACIAGLTAKETKSPIGYFGTGLKYAIASILRWGGRVVIYSGETRYAFQAAELNFRGKTFSQVCMNGEQLGFTTDYGKDWQPWQVFRELYSNARDEDGSVELAFDSLSRPMDNELGKTVILISGVQDLIDCYYERDEIILPLDKTWTHETSYLQFSPSPSAHVYYRGVRVADTRCSYTWNVLNEQNLTEDRTLRDSYSVGRELRRFVLNDCKDETVIEHMLNVWQDSDFSFESNQMQFLNIPPAPLASEHFKAVALRLFRRDPRKWNGLKNLCFELDPSLVSLGTVKLNSRQETMLRRAIELVSRFGFEREVAELPISVKELGPSTLGQYSQGRVFLSPALFELGTKQLVSTLYEECYHHRTAKKDCTYDMQTDLFNIIISLNEEIHNVIC